MKLLKTSEDHEVIAGLLKKAELTSLIKVVCLDKDVDEACESAKKYGICSVAAMPQQIPRVLANLNGSGVKTTCIMDMMGGAVVAWPALELTFHEFIESGVNKFDLMLSLDKLAAQDYAGVKFYWKHFAEIAHNGGCQLYATIEEGLFDDKVKLLLCKLALEAGVDGIRTCTGCIELCGMPTGRATIHDICLIKASFGDTLLIKAGGGTDFGYLEDALEYIECGASYVDLGTPAIKQLNAIGYPGKEQNR